MRSSSRKMPDPGFRFGVKRTGLASLLCAILRPGDAKAASVNAESVRLVVGSRSREVALRDIETVEEKTGRLWAGIRLGHATGAATVSGLSRAEANALADAIETARVDWWRGTLAPQIGMLRSVHDRLAGFADPPEIRRRRYPPGPHARCAGGSRRLGGALAGLPVRCTGNPDAEGHPGVSGSARRCAFKSQRDFRRERAGPVARPVRTGSRPGR